MARNLTNCVDGFLKRKRYLLMDRDAKFCAGFRGIVDREGVKAVRLPPSSPNLNSHLERFFRSVKEEALHRMIFFGERSLAHAVRQFLLHYAMSPPSSAGGTILMLFDWTPCAQV